MGKLVAQSDAAGDAILVETIAATVRRNGTVVALTGRERELAIAMAVQSHPACTAVLGRLLYPDREDDEASNVLRVHVYRLRRRIAPDFIVWRDSGYALGAGVHVDISEARILLDELSRAPRTLTNAERDHMLTLARGLRSDSPASLLEHEWYEAFSRRARRLGHDLAILIGRVALDAGEIREAMRIGQELTYDDSCDEEAWELLIRAQLVLGNQVAAVQGFRFYEAALARELDATPSVQIRHLVECL